MHLVSFERLGKSGKRTARAVSPLRDGPAAKPSSAAPDFASLTSTRHAAKCVGAIIGLGRYAGWVVDLNRAFAIRLAYDDVGAPEAEADSLAPPDILAFLRLGSSARRAAEMALEFALDSLDRYDAPDVLRAGAVVPSGDVRILSPVPRPGKIIGVLDNYRDPAISAAPLDEPALFIKASSAAIGPEDVISLPSHQSQVDVGGTLAVVIGARARRVSVDAALGCVAGYMPAADVTDRGVAGGGDRQLIGKSRDSFAPMGPELVTVDEAPDPQALSLRTIVSGQQIQLAATKEMCFSVAAIVAAASSIATLEPGDVILTGTPAGVGAEAHPARWLRDGDLVEVEIDGLGRLRNHVAAWKPSGV